MEGLEELTLELCDTCPQQCLHCSSNSSPSCAEELGIDIALDIVRQAASLGTKKLSLGGGEPLLSPSLGRILDEAAKFGMQLELFTCGIATLPPTLTGLPEHLLKDWAKLPNLKVIFSLQGAKALTHEYVTQSKGSYDVLLKSLRSCVLAGITCEINFVPLKPNADEFGQLLEVAEKLGVHQISVLRFVPQGRGWENRGELELTREEEDAFVRKLVRLRERKKIEIRTGSPFNGIVPGNRVPCRAGARKLVIQANGNVLPCEVFKHHQRCIWNLNIHKQSLGTILRSQSLARLRSKLEDSDCLHCPVHAALRKQQKTEGENERVPEPAIHT